MEYSVQRHLPRCAVLVGVLGIVSTAWAAPAWTTPASPTSVAAGYTSGQIAVYGLPNNQGCSQSTITFLPADSDPARVLALVTSAILSGKNLTCYVSGCNGNYQRGQFCQLVQ